LKRDIAIPSDAGIGFAGSEAPPGRGGTQASGWARAIRPVGRPLVGRWAAAQERVTPNAGGTPGATGLEVSLGAADRRDGRRSNLCVHSPDSPDSIPEEEGWSPILRRMVRPTSALCDLRCVRFAGRKADRREVDRRRVTVNVNYREEDEQREQERYGEEMRKPPPPCQRAVTHLLTLPPLAEIPQCSPPTSACQPPMEECVRCLRSRPRLARGRSLATFNREEWERA
jgi:hypothetical protein